MRGHLLTILLTIAACYVFAVANSIVPLPTSVLRSLHAEGAR